MDTHNNARLTPKGREAMVRAVVDHGLRKAAAARQFNTTAKTVAKWVGRFLVLGIEGLGDCSSRPQYRNWHNGRHRHFRTSLALRRKCWAGLIS